MPPNTGIYVVVALGGAAGERLRAIQAEYDPKLAAWLPPHVTIAGSSGMGPIRPDTPLAALRAALEPVAAATPPLVLRFERPMRFMQTNIVVLPLDPHGPLRALHEAIKSSGLPYEHPRFAFSPHATLSFYRTLTPETERKLLAMRVDEPVLVDHIAVTMSRDPFAPKTLLELELRGMRARDEGEGRHGPPYPPPER